MIQLKTKPKYQIPIWLMIMGGVASIVASLLINQDSNVLGLIILSFGLLLIIFGLLKIRSYEIDDTGLTIFYCFGILKRRVHFDKITRYNINHIDLSKSSLPDSQLFLLLSSKKITQYQVLELQRKNGFNLQIDERLIADDGYKQLVKMIKKGLKKKR